MGDADEVAAKDVSVGDRIAADEGEGDVFQVDTEDGQIRILIELEGGGMKGVMRDPDAPVKLVRKS